MRRILLLLILFCLTVGSWAQTQQGYVKTKGRLGSDGKVIVGTRISGAAIHVKGRSAVLSQANGTFSFPLRDKSFCIQSVQKKGFVLTDPEALYRPLAYSSNPLVIVLETPSQQADDKLAAEQKIRRTLQRQLVEKEEEIENLRKKNKLTQEEYRKALQELYSSQQSNESLISEMAERYALVDYDQLDSKTLEINQCILNGQLRKADSILTQKGDLNMRLKQLDLEKSTIEKEKYRLKKAEGNLREVETGYQKAVMNFGRDCYTKFELCDMRYESDSAAYYIQLRAKADPTNLIWQIDASRYLAFSYSNYESAMAYANFALTLAKTQYGDNDSQVADCYILIGNIYQLQAKYDEAIKSIETAHEINRMAGSDIGSAYCCESLGRLYYKLEQINKSIEWFKLEVDLLKKVYGEECVELADVYQWLAASYVEVGDSRAGADIHEKALNLLISTYGKEHYKVALCYHTLGEACSRLGRIQYALNYYGKELAIYQNSPEKYIRLMADCYRTMGNTISSTDVNKAKEYTEQSIRLYEKVYAKNHPIVGNCYAQLGLICTMNKQFDEAVNNEKHALAIQERILGQFHPDVAQTYSNLGTIFMMKKEFDTALVYLQKSVDIEKQVFSTDNLTLVAPSYIMMGLIYASKGNLNKASEYYRKVENISNLTEIVPQASQLKLILEAAGKLKL